MTKTMRLCAILFVFCVALPAQEVKAMDMGQGIISIDAKQLEEQLAAASAPVLIDVRQPSEYEDAHIQGAKLIPLGELPERLAEIPKDKPVVVYCRSGARSARAAAFLREKGFTNIENLSGGMISWVNKCQTSKNYC
jgi:rhodanese-related sulfurtransferase